MSRPRRERHVADLVNDQQPVSVDFLEFCLKHVFLGGLFQRRQQGCGIVKPYGVTKMSSDTRKQQRFRRCMIPG